MEKEEYILAIKLLKQPQGPEEEPELAPESQLTQGAGHLEEPTPEPEPTEEQAEQETEELWPEDIPGADKTQPEPSQPEPAEKPLATASEEAKGFTDMVRLEEQLKTLQGKKLKAWSESNLLSYIKTTYKVEGKTVLEAVAKLDKGAATHFKKRVEETLQMI